MSQNLANILLVDDEPINLLLLEDLLESEGYMTTSATSGKEALAVAKLARPNLILLDIMMPEMSGFEVCDILRQDPVLNTISIIFLTALDDDQSRIKGIEKMGDDYITKPFNSQLLLAKIANILKLNQLRSHSMEAETKKRVLEQTKSQIAVAQQTNQYLSDKLRLFVPDQFLARIAPRGIESIKLGEITELELSILFCDIRGFTTITESQTATDTFQWLNAFFNKMSMAIAAYHGFIDKFMGDAIMAVFDRDNFHALDAIQAAVMMQENLRDFNNNRAQYHLAESVKIGVGIHTGIATIGTIGSNLRMDSTVIGDVVNTASRLESLTKIYNCPILASGVTIHHLESCQKFANNLQETINKNSRNDHNVETIELPPPTTKFSYNLLTKVIPAGKQESIDLYQILW